MFPHAVIQTAVAVATHRVVCKTQTWVVTCLPQEKLREAIAERERQWRQLSATFEEQLVAMEVHIALDLHHAPRPLRSLQQH